MTIVDIAKESGYSVTTVSRVLNNRRDVSPAAKKKIMEIVEAHNFVPNNNAKRLKQTKTKSILVVAKGTSNMLFTSIVEEIQKFGFPYAHDRYRSLPSQAENNATVN